MFKVYYTHRVFDHISPVWSYIVLWVGIQPPGKLLNGWGHGTTELQGRKTSTTTYWQRFSSTSRIFPDFSTLWRPVLLLDDTIAPPSCSREKSSRTLVLLPPVTELYRKRTWDFKMHFNCWCECAVCLCACFLPCVRCRGAQQEPSPPPSKSWYPA